MFELKVAGSKLATFDVFDTLLHRQCSPETIILQTCRDIARALSVEPNLVIEARNSSVALLRSLTFDPVKGFDGEYRFADLAGELSKRISDVTGLATEHVREVVHSELAREIEREQNMVFPNPTVIELARRIRAKGVQLAAVSDMYHSKDVIASLLRAVGAGDLFDAGNIFVSSEYSVTKESGRLYDIVLDRYGLDACQTCHIGDNRRSDYRSALFKGISAFHYDAAHCHDRYRRDYNSQESESMTGFAAHEAGVTALDLSKGTHRIAAAIAPVLCEFALDVSRRARELHVDGVWFMARDGYLPMKLYELFNDGSSPASRYLHVSRKSVSKASSSFFGMREAFMAQWNGESRKIRTILAPLELNPMELQRVTNLYGFASPEEEIDYPQDPRFHRLLEDKHLQEIYAEDAALRRRRLNSYLEATGFLANRHVAVVDVGWAGQIQEALERSLPKERRPKVSGLYMALRSLGGLRRLAGHDMEGLIYDCGRHDPVAASIFNAVDVFEDTCRAHHGTVVGYTDSGDPVLAADTMSRNAEKADEPRLRLLQEAIMLYAARWIRYVRTFQVDMDVLRETAITTVGRLMRFPTSEEASFFMSVGHSLDAGSDELLHNTPMTGGRLLPSLSHIRLSRWKEAAAADYVFRPILQALIQMKRKRQARLPR